MEHVRKSVCVQQYAYVLPLCTGMCVSVCVTVCVCGQVYDSCCVTAYACSEVYVFACVCVLHIYV